MPNASDKIVLELTDRFVDLASYTRTVRGRVLSMLYVLEQDIIKAIGAQDFPSSLSRAESERRLNALLKSVQDSIKSRYTTAANRLAVGNRELASLVQDAVVGAVNTVFTVDILTPTLTATELRVLADSQTVLGLTTNENWDRISEATRYRFNQEMRNGIAAGETNEQLIARVRGKATRQSVVVEAANGKKTRVRKFQGGIMDTSRHEAERMVRDATQTVSNRVLERTYAENDDVVKGHRAITTLDDRTSKTCINRTGGAWFLDGTPMPESSVDYPFPGYPPWHYFCRTIMGPVTFTWEELIEKHTGKKLKALNSVPDSVRASFDGLVSTERIKTFDDFLRLKGPDFARRKLGPSLYKFWSEGNITTKDLLDSIGRPRTVSEVRELVARR